MNVKVEKDPITMAIKQEIMRINADIEQIRYNENEKFIANVKSENVAGDKLTNYSDVNELLDEDNDLEQEWQPMDFSHRESGQDEENQSHHDLIDENNEYSSTNIQRVLSGNNEIEIAICGQTFDDNLEETTYSYNNPFEKTKSLECDIGDRLAPKLDITLNCEKFQCANCETIFSDKRVLIEHINSIHSDKTENECDICQEKLFTKQSFKIHKILHNGEGAFECGLCKKKFYWKQSLKQHKLIHNEDKKYECVVCEKKFSLNDNLKQHELVHSMQTSFRCNICAKILSSKESFLIHKMIHVGKGAFQCDDCKIKFYWEQSLIQHRLTHETVFKCEKCGKEFKLKSALIKHVKLKHSKKVTFQCDVYKKKKHCKERSSREIRRTIYKNKRKKKEHLTQPKSNKNQQETKIKRVYNTKKNREAGLIQNISTDETFECNICGKKLSSKRYLKNHELTHSGDKQFKCESCDRRFFWKKSLNQHKLIHRGEKQFVCDICGNKYNYKQSLKDHKLTHKEASFECAICSRKFWQKRHFKQHMRIHNDVAPHECDICKKRFNWKDGLNRHKLAIHNDDSVPREQYECNICFKKFNWKKGFKKHVSLHTGELVECDVCEGKFAKDYLRIHKQIHIGEKTFVCDVCEKAFDRKRYLMSHVRLVHSEVE